MICEYCNENMKDGTYVCTAEGYSVLDSNDNLVQIVATHSGIPADDEEVDESEPVKYCKCQVYFLNYYRPNSGGI